MQNTPINPNLLPLYTALGIAAYNGCINAQDLLNDRVSYNLWPSIHQTIENFLNQYQEHKIHVFYCQRDEQVFSLEQLPAETLWDYAIDPDANSTCQGLTEDEVWEHFLQLEADPTFAWFDYTDPETNITHHIFCLLDI